MLALNVVSGVSSAAAGKCQADRADKLAIRLCNELVKVLRLFEQTFNRERVRPNVSGIVLIVIVLVYHFIFHVFYNRL